MYIIYDLSEEGEDYIGLSDEEIFFSRMSRTSCFNVTIMNDGDCEDFEHFTISLSSSAQRVSVSPSYGHVVIRDPPLCSKY